MASEPYANGPLNEVPDIEGELPLTMEASEPTSPPSPIGTRVTFGPHHADVVDNNFTENDVSGTREPFLAEYDKWDEKPNLHTYPSSTKLVDLESQEQGFRDQVKAPKVMVAVDTAWLQQPGYETTVNYNGGWHETLSLEAIGSPKSSGDELKDESPLEEEHTMIPGDREHDPCHESSASVPKHPLTSITEGMADVDMDDLPSKRTSGMPISPDNVSMQPDEVYHHPTRTVVLPKPSTGSTFLGASYVEADNAKSQMVRDKAPNLRNSAAVPTVPSSNTTGMKAVSDSRRDSNAGTYRPRGLSVLEVSPGELHEVSLDSEAQNKSGTTEPTIYEEYEDISTDVRDHLMGHCHENDKGTVPTYRYPGTYEAAKHDTYEAAKNMGSAALTFGGALVSSGIGKAAWSVGALSLDVSRRAGKHVATQAILNSGYKDTLPTGVQNWVDKNEQKRILKAEAKKHRYQYTDQQGRRGSRYKLGSPWSPAVAYTTGEDTNKNVPKHNEHGPYSMGANATERDREDDWEVMSQKDLAGLEVRGKASPLDTTKETPYSETAQGSTTAFLEPGVNKAGKVGGPGSSATKNVRDQPGHSNPASR